MIKKHWKRAEKAKNTPLGPRSGWFDSSHSDQKSLKSLISETFSLSIAAQMMVLHPTLNERYCFGRPFRSPVVLLISVTISISHAAITDY